KIGILGGTFDPVHDAHLAMARAALEQLDLERMLWMPTGKPRYRDAPVAAPEHRLAMLRLELGGDPTLVLLIGADQYEKLGTWHRAEEVKRLARIAVVKRPGIEKK